MQDGIERDFEKQEAEDELKQSVVTNISMIIFGVIGLCKTAIKLIKQ